MNTEQVCVFILNSHFLNTLAHAAGAPLASRASHTLAIPIALARLPRRAPLVPIPPREAKRAQLARLLLLLLLLRLPLLLPLLLLLLLLLETREKERSRRGSRRSALGSQLAAPPSLARSQSALASAVASDSTSSSSSWDWPALRYLKKYRTVCGCPACCA